MREDILYNLTCGPNQPGVNNDTLDAGLARLAYATGQFGLDEILVIVGRKRNITNRDWIAGVVDDSALSKVRAKHAPK